MTSQQKPRGTKPNPVPAGSTRQAVKPATGKKQKNATSKSFLQRLNEWFDEHTRLVLYTALALSVVIGIFLFDVKISTGGDDSSYIEMANNFMKGRSFPSWHGPLYPIFLSLPMLFVWCERGLAEAVFICVRHRPSCIVLLHIQTAHITCTFCPGIDDHCSEFHHPLFCQSNIQ